MTHSITLNAQVHGPSRHYDVVARFSKLASELPDDVDHSVSVYKLPENAPSERYEELCYDDGTLFRAMEAAMKAGLTKPEAIDVVREMQNAGILFRERPAS